GELVRIHTLLLAGRLDAAEALLGKALEESPESLFRTQLCFLHCMRWKETAARRDVEGGLRESVLAYRAATEAATAPTLIPFGPGQAGHLLLCWQRAEPRDVRPYRLLARLALRRGDAARALAWTRRGQALHPWDLELAKVGGEARAALARPAGP